MEVFSLLEASSHSHSFWEGAPQINSSGKSINMTGISGGGKSSCPPQFITECVMWNQPIITHSINHHLLWHTDLPESVDFTPSKWGHSLFFPIHCLTLMLTLSRTSSASPDCWKATITLQQKARQAEGTRAPGINWNLTTVSILWRHFWSVANGSFCLDCFLHIIYNIQYKDWNSYYAR